MYDRCNQSFFGPWQSHFPRLLSIVTDSTRYVRDRPIRRANRIYFTLCLKRPERSLSHGWRSVQTVSFQLHVSSPRSRISTVNGGSNVVKTGMHRNRTGDTVRLPHQKQIITNERSRVASTSRLPGLRFPINTARLWSTNCIMPRGSSREHANQAQRRSAFRDPIATCPCSLSLSLFLYSHFSISHKLFSYASFSSLRHRSSISYELLALHDTLVGQPACFFSPGGQIRFRRYIRHCDELQWNIELPS